MSRYRQTMSEALKQIKEQDSDHEISMARGELEAIADKATQLASALQGKSDDGNPLEAWVQSKITKAKDYINSVSDYMMYNPDMKQNESALGWTLVSKAKDLAKKFANNYTKAVDEIEKLQKGLSKNASVEKELMKYNESLEEKFTVQITKKDGTTMELGRYNTAAEAQRFVDMYGKGAKVKKESVNEELELDESRMKDIFTANQEGESAEEIAKRLKLDIKTVKSILGEETINEKVADSIIKDLQKAYAPLKGKTISPQMATKISKHLDGQSYDVVTLRQLMKADIPFISTLARNKIYKKTGKFENFDNYPTSDINKHKKDIVNDPKKGEKKPVNEGAKLTFEAISAVKKKAEKTGMPYSILKKVYDRGMAAWRGGHRPGAGQVQWALARVNSFVTKSSGTWGGADKDLAAKVKGSK